LEAGEGVPAGVSIRADTDAGRGLIVIALANKTRLLAACSETPCSASLQIPANLLGADDRSFHRMLDAVLFVLFKKDTREASGYESTSSRGPGVHRSELIVDSNPKQPISLGVEFRHLPAGAYHLEIRQASAVVARYSNDVTWRATQTDLSVPMLSPGIYSVAIINRAGVQTSDILLAVVEESSFDSINADYLQARERCADWDEDSHHIFLRAYLVARQKNP
jgi:hypothetical protein